MTSVAADAKPPSNNKTKVVSQVCKVTSEAEIATLFERWNKTLKTGNSNTVLSNYAKDSVLIPTVSNKVRFTYAEKKEYLDSFLKHRPHATVNSRTIRLGCNTAFDVGTYTLTFDQSEDVIDARYSFTYIWDGKKWLVQTHHSSSMPEVIPNP
ncbi:MULTISPECIES: DUF4440 domain-containing protein [unclassified Acinetobacter]|uniref:DUF4440 domain-containing protein n=1 Tax=unclassified Acinetobacter TaxID=196816 RepID=UPI0035B9145A